MTIAGATGDWLGTALGAESEAGRERVRLAIADFGLAFFQTDLATGQLFVTPNAFSMFGLPVPAGMPVDRSPFWECYHPEDAGWARERFAADLRGERGQDSYHERVRIFRRDDGALRWIEFSGRMFGPPGARTHIVGMLRDVTEAAEAEERQRLLMREVDHRANNMLAVVQSLIRATRGADLPDYRARLEARVLSLARTQSLVAMSGWGATGIEALVESELAAHRDRIELRLDALPPLATVAIQPMAMVLHELATNAAKHGALSLPAGRVVLALRAGAGEVLLEWREEGGPRIAAPPAREGTGMAVIRAQLRRLGAMPEWRWGAEGLHLSARFPLARWGG